MSGNVFKKLHNLVNCIDQIRSSFLIKCQVFQFRFNQFFILSFFLYENYLIYELVKVIKTDFINVFHKFENLIKEDLRLF